MSPAIRPRPVKVKPPRVKQWTVDGWTGMYDTRSAKAEREGKAALLVNLIPTDTEKGGSVALRSGRRYWGASSAPDLGTKVQYVGHHRLASGPMTIAVVDGELYKLDWFAGTTTKMVSTANLTTASLTLSAALPVYAVDFNGTVVFADGGHSPFTWDGTAGAGGLTKLTNAPSTQRGAPTVYYAKLFFIKLDGQTIVWSEENQANTGYDTAPYNNAWEITQSSQADLTALIGTNEGLYYFRATGVGVIRGAVSSTFATDGVHDSIATGVGVTGPNACTYVANSLFWYDARGRLWAYRAGGELVEIGKQLPRIYGTITTTNHPDTAAYGGVGESWAATMILANVSVDYWRQRVLFSGSAASTNGRVGFLFDAGSLELLSVLTYPTANPMSSNQLRSSCFATYTVDESISFEVYFDSSARLFYEMTGSGSVTPEYQDYTESTTGSPVTGIIIGRMHGWSPTIEWQFTQLDVLTDELAANSITVGYITSRFHKASLAPAAQAASSGSVPNTPYEKHRAFGLNTTGRWLRPIITILGGQVSSNSGSRAQIFGYTLTAVPVSQTPSLT